MKILISICQRKRHPWTGDSSDDDFENFCSLPFWHFRFAFSDERDFLFSGKILKSSIIPGAVVEKELLFVCSSISSNINSCPNRTKLLPELRVAEMIRILLKDSTRKGVSPRNKPFKKRAGDLVNHSPGDRCETHVTLIHSHLVSSKGSLSAIRLFPYCHLGCLTPSNSSRLSTGLRRC